jgi:hypothetical protein
VGDQFYNPLGISFDNRWRDLGILIAFTVQRPSLLDSARTFLFFSASSHSFTFSRCFAIDLYQIFLDSSSLFIVPKRRFIRL